MIRDGGWTEDYYFKSFGTELDGSTVGFVGFGNVAKETAKRLSAFNMRILAYDPYVSAEAMKEYGAEKTEDLEKAGFGERLRIKPLAGNPRYKRDA